MSDHNQDNEPQMQLQMPPEVQRGAYANETIISHTREEFVMDYILATPPIGVVNARVLISPTHAKRLMLALQENIAKYEEQYGELEYVSPVTGTPEGGIRH
jgi:hypothetical protein